MRYITLLLCFSILLLLPFGVFASQEVGAVGQTANKQVKALRPAAGALAGLEAGMQEKSNLYFAGYNTAPGEKGEVAGVFKSSDNFAFHIQLLEVLWFMLLAAAGFLVFSRQEVKTVSSTNKKTKSKPSKFKNLKKK